MPRKRQYVHEQRRAKNVELEHKWPLFLRASVSTEDGGVSWTALGALRALPKNPLRLTLFLRVMSVRLGFDLPTATARFKSERPLNKSEQEAANAALKVSILIEDTRIARRSALLEQIPLTDERYENENLDMCTMLWLVGCQCNLYVHYMLTPARSTKTGADFLKGAHVRQLVMYQNVRIAKYPMSALRMVVLRIVKMWAHLPVLDDEFVEYLQLVRLRASELQCMAYKQSKRTLDYPPWVKTAGEFGGVVYERATLDMARQLELYFYHLARHIDHERAYNDAAVACSKRWCTAADRSHLHEWLKARVQNVFLDQWRREVVERAMLVELLPPEREVFKYSNPSANYDTKNVLRYMRTARHDQINEILLASPEKMLEREPVVAIVYQVLFLMQAEAASFSFDRFIYWCTDLPLEQDGCAYPSPTYFTGFDYPVIYCPLALKRFWVICDGAIIRCEDDILFAIALWLRIVLGLTEQRPAFEELLALRFNVLRRCLLREGFDSPIIVPKPAAPAATTKVPTNTFTPPPVNASLSVLLQAIIEQQHNTGHAKRLADAAQRSGAPMDTEDPAPTPTMMEF